MGLTWLITGATGGLGSGVLRAVLDGGDSVVAAVRRPDALADVEAQYGDRVRVVSFDLADPESIDAAIATATDRFGRLDVLVNNAGYADSVAAEDLSEEGLRAHFETNFFGAVAVTRAALPTLRAQGAGHIMQISSVAGRFGATPGLSAYYATKRALEGWSEVLAVEVAPLGLHVTIVQPGAFRTRFVTGATHVPPSDAYRHTVGARQAYRRQRDGKAPGDPRRAGQVLFELSREADPPLRLLLGNDAIDNWTKAAADMDAELRAWEAVGRSTDFVTAAEPV